MGWHGRCEPGLGAGLVATPLGPGHQCIAAMRAAPAATTTSYALPAGVGLRARRPRRAFGSSAPTAGGLAALRGGGHREDAPRRPHHDRPGLRAPPAAAVAASAASATAAAAAAPPWALPLLAAVCAYCSAYTLLARGRVVGGRGGGGGGVAGWGPWTGVTTGHGRATAPAAWPHPGRPTSHSSVGPGPPLPPDCCHGSVGRAPASPGTGIRRPARRRVGA